MSFLSKLARSLAGGALSNPQAAKQVITSGFAGGALTNPAIGSAAAKSGLLGAIPAMYGSSPIAPPQVYGSAGIPQQPNFSPQISNVPRPTIGYNPIQQSQMNPMRFGR